MQYDVVIVGAGPAGLACAIRLKQLKPAANVCVLEKASAVGAHALSGAVLEPGPLDALLPEWPQEYTGMKVPAAADDFRIFTAVALQAGARLAVRLLPRSMTCYPVDNHGNFIISLGQLTPWLAQQAEALGVDVFPGFAAAAPLFDETDAVAGVRIGDMGLDRRRRAGSELHPGRGDPRAHHRARRGCRGSSIAKQLIRPLRARRAARVRRPTAWAEGAVAAARRAACSPG